MSVEMQAWLEKKYYQKNPSVYVQGWVVRDSTVFIEYLSNRVYSKLIDSEGQKIISELMRG